MLLLNPVEFLTDWLAFVPMASFWADYIDTTLPFLPHSLYLSSSMSHSDSLYIYPICPCSNREDERGISLSEKKLTYSCYTAKIAVPHKLN